MYLSSALHRRLEELQRESEHGKQAWSKTGLMNVRVCLSQTEYLFIHRYCIQDVLKELA